MRDKIAVEEHFVTPELQGCIASVGWSPQAWRRVIDGLEDVDRRLAQMDELGIGRAVLSLGSDGIQGIADPADATRTARAANDALAQIVAAHPDRFAGFAAIALQDPGAAGGELERAVHELGFKGALVNGYSDTPSGPRYYDDASFLPFWERVAGLGVPVYLHPRNPLPGTPMLEGRPELLGPTWAFAIETGTHALRLVVSGLFDRFPELQIVLGHMGEFLPFAMARLEQRLAHVAGVNLGVSPRQVLRDNFWITISGNYHAPSLVGAMLELGSDRLLFACDHPFEDMADGARWFDEVAISEADRVKIGRTNAERLLGLDLP
ncbi:MAG TPA: amidohydrolase family protein [Solirubrobacteraceae bacterium]|jgi:2,3-dihydroxybenzoate decarboxylase|nr:amidohydrolase family protein [Solirubrobacteraceae bacterium]